MLVAFMESALDCKKNVTELFLCVIESAACHFLNRSVKQGPRNSRKERERDAMHIRKKDTMPPEERGRERSPGQNFLFFPRARDE